MLYGTAKTNKHTKNNKNKKRQKFGHKFKERQTGTEGRCCEDTQEKMAMWLKWCISKPGTPRIAGKHQKLGSSKEGSSSRAVRGSMALPTPWCRTSSLQNNDTIRFYCFNPPRFWYVVMAPSKRKHYGMSFLRSGYEKIVVSILDILSLSQVIPS